MPVFKVFIKAKDNKPIYGIGFRDFVGKLLAKNEKFKEIKGLVRNRKTEEDVELQAFCLNEKNFEEILEIVREKTIKSFNMELEISKIMASENEGFFSKEFEAIREDDLKEMFWALQGAKNEFQKLYVKTMEAEEQRKLRRLKGLETELNKLKDIFSENRAQTLKDYKWEAIIQFLVEPFNDDLNSVLNDLDSTLQEAREFKGRKKEELIQLTQKVNLMLNKSAELAKFVKKETIEKIEEIMLKT